MPYKDPEKAREYHRNYRAANREKLLAYSREWSRAEKGRERARAWRAANRERRREWRNANAEKLLDASRKWRAANRERARATQRQWVAANRDKVYEAQRAHRKAAQAPTVYICYDENDQALYVGKTNNFQHRQRQHRHHSPWFHLTKRTETRSASSPEEMHLLEAQLIAELKPPYNKDGRLLKSTHKPTVYVHYDENGQPLYVGKTVNFKGRQSEHRNRSPWYHLVRRTETTAVSSAEEMHLLEAKLIAELKPQFNRDGRFLSREGALEIPPNPQLELWASGVAAP